METVLPYMQRHLRYSAYKKTVRWQQSIIWTVTLLEVILNCYQNLEYCAPQLISWHGIGRKGKKIGQLFSFLFSILDKNCIKKQSFSQAMLMSKSGTYLLDLFQIEASDSNVQNLAIIAARNQNLFHKVFSIRFQCCPLLKLKTLFKLVEWSEITFYTDIKHKCLPGSGRKVLIQTL